MTGDTGHIICDAFCISATIRKTQDNQCFPNAGFFGCMTHFQIKFTFQNKILQKLLFNVKIYMNYVFWASKNTKKLDRLMRRKKSKEEI